MKTIIHFTIEELTLIKNHKNINTSITRKELIEILKESIKYSDSEIIKEWMTDTVRKLEHLTDNEFSEIDYTMAMDAED